ncbi:MAG: hypothetical protein A2Y56_14065 [Candidatus Aminicenantes bacterium RBG_13_63_10]|nr:MAG: hypothetical protein A2Y56_14065 [Candidatus Aminicenantes bacterium RBG_13_63_10]
MAGERRPGRGLGLAGAGLVPALCLLVLTAGSPAARPAGQEVPAAQPVEDNLLRLLQISPSAESLDYVMTKTQFQLHTLLTEQRHPKTMSLSEKARTDLPGGLRMLLSVDDDVSAALGRLAAEPAALETMAEEIASAIREKRKIYIYGCGATGRLAKQMESSFWRPFWRRLKAEPSVWARLRSFAGEDIENRLIGEMTGGDRALISSLEGFEDLQLIGRLQLQDRKVEHGDIVIAVTEGGETSSVIGTIRAALDQWKRRPDYSPANSRRRLYFVYNNPDSTLMPFERSRAVLEEPGITKVNLTTGPQAITGSTRMQATTIETFVIGHVLQEAVERTLQGSLSKKDMARAGFDPDRTIAERLSDFSGILKSVREAVPGLAVVTELEAGTYGRNRFSTYFARRGLITVFIDSTERSPTFRLLPLDTVREPARKCWIQVWTDARGPGDAWRAFLGRPFRGLKPELYQRPFEEEIEDPYLKTAALESLKKAGDDQQALYDFSLEGTFNQGRRPAAGDLAATIILSQDEEALGQKDSPFIRFLDFAGMMDRRGVIIAVSSDPPRGNPRGLDSFLRRAAAGPNPPLILSLRVPSKGDAFGINPQVALKVLLNAHSTAVMARLGRVVGNTMTSVSPSNLKLIGRATYLIQSHVNDVLARPQRVQRYGVRRPVTYGEANAVLFDAIRFVKGRSGEAGRTAEVGLSIIRVLESLKAKSGLPPERALALLKSKGLDRYLAEAAGPGTAIRRP